LKISNIESFQLGEEVPGGATWAGNSIVVRVTTSNGVVGYGEAVPTLRVQPVLKSIDEVARVYRGKDPMDFEANMHEWHKHDFYLPVSFESTTALSAVDIACWDIAGKALGVPIHRLIGGKTRERVKHYSNGWYAGCVTPEQFAKAARRFHSMGYEALKFDPFGPYYDYIDAQGLDVAHDRVKAVRDATGGKVLLLIEHHGRFNPNSAIMIARRLREFDPLFMEEPVHPENMIGLKKYREATDVRVALGERLLTPEQTLQALSENLLDFLQIDITNVGGVTRAKKISAIAEAFGVEMAFHNAFGPIQNAVTIQVDAAIPNFLIQESFYDIFPEWKRKLVKNGTRVAKGRTEVSDRPGLGVEVDERVLEEYAAKGQEPFNPVEPVWAVRGTWKNH
jgi:gluconate/galactonate dehydratase